jgi:hypothetical protein
LKFFKNSKDGKVTMTFSEEEVLVVIDLLEFTGKLCQTLAQANRKNENGKNAEDFTQRAIEAISLSDRFIDASDPDKANGVIH